MAIATLYFKKEPNGNFALMGRPDDQIIPSKMKNIFEQAKLSEYKTDAGKVSTWIDFEATIFPPLQGNPNYLLVLTAMDVRLRLNINIAPQTAQIFTRWQPAPQIPPLVASVHYSSNDVD